MFSLRQRVEIIFQALPLINADIRAQFQQIESTLAILNRKGFNAGNSMFMKCWKG